MLWPRRRGASRLGRSADLTAVLRDALVPVLQQLLRPEEIDRVTLQRNESAVWV
nr:hypothetical protein [Geodermatophilaceae bacterium]